MTPFEMRSRKMYEKFTIYENGLISANFVFFFSFYSFIMDRRDAPVYEA